VGEAGARVLVIQPDPSAEELLRPARRLLDEVHHFVSPLVARLGRAAIGELSSTDPLARMHLEGLALELLAVSARITPPRKLPAAFLRTLERIHDEFRSRLTVMELASEAGLNPTYYARVFRERTGVSVAEYIAELRIRWAAERILRSKEPLGRIGVAAGFADQSHFNRTFKRVCGLTPGQFRSRGGIRPNRSDSFNPEID